MTDLVPWLGLLAILGLTAALEGRIAVRSEPHYPTRRERAVGALLLAWGLYANGVGAIFPEANTCWNERPVELTDNPARLWDWGDPQFLGWRRSSCQSIGDAGLGPENL